MSETTVLVEYNERRKPIAFDNSAGVPALKEAIKGSFSITSESHCLLIQPKMKIGVVCGWMLKLMMKCLIEAC